MVYQELSPLYDGGVIDRDKLELQDPSRPVVVVGLGGTSVAALSALKGKIRRRLKPDDPLTDFPRYDGIRLLGIDTDDSSFREGKGLCSLEPEECLQIGLPNLEHALRSGEFIRHDSRMNWMELNSTNRTIVPVGSGGLRQVGRFQLIQRAVMLRDRLTQACFEARNVRIGPMPLEVYVLAGLAGGTGGCFVDVCYILRHIAENHGWNIHITGCFFLPDVAVSKAGPAARMEELDRYQANGYAALKELDYLMDLPAAGGRFVQDYGFGTVDTQKPPVDLCCLVSATNADGTIMQNGYKNCLDTVTDYVTEALSSGRNIPGLRSHMLAAAAAAPTHMGKPLYHILGGCSAEVPVIRIDTLLAARFFRRFRQLTQVPEGTVTRQTVQALMEHLGLTGQKLAQMLQSKMPALDLDDIDRRTLRQMGPMGLGQLPQPWAVQGNNWLSQCQAEAATQSSLWSRSAQSGGPDSLAGRLYAQLCQLCRDPGTGPRYVLALLESMEHSLDGAICGELAWVEKREENAQMQAHYARQQVTECSMDFCGTMFPGNRYWNYKEAVHNRFQVERDCLIAQTLKQVLYRLREQIKELQMRYFRPLWHLLDNLDETFRPCEELRFWGLPPQEGCTRHAVWVEDTAVEIYELTDNAAAGQVVGDFMAHILDHEDRWLDGDPRRIARMVEEFVLELFRKERLRDLKSRLIQRYPGLRAYQEHVKWTIEREILERIHVQAAPNFRFSPVPVPWVEDVELVTVPGGVTEAGEAITEYLNVHPTSHWSAVPGGYRFGCLRLLSGVPLAAYGGLQRMKACYDASLEVLHLYAGTGREDSPDWRTCLPELPV